MTNALRISAHPAHRLRHLGAAALSTPELLAVVLGQPDALTRAGKLLTASRFSLRKLAQLERGALSQFHDVKLSAERHARLAAALELGRRLSAETAEEGAPVRAPRDVARLYAPVLEDLQHEEFHVVVLDAQHRPKIDVCVTKGILTSSLVHPREVFARAITERAAAIILVHNHPSGDPTPSDDDRAITDQLVSAGKMLDIPVHDHVIIGRGRYTSFAEAGLL